VSCWWFDAIRPILENHVIATPHPNVTIARLGKPFPIEFVARAHLTGSTGTLLWTHHNKGEHIYFGLSTQDGMRKNQQFPSPIITPTTKSAEHDRPISAQEIVAEGWMSAEHYSDAANKALKLFETGQ